LWALYYSLDNVSSFYCYCFVDSETEKRLNSEVALITNNNINNNNNNSSSLLENSIVECSFDLSLKTPAIRDTPDELIKYLREHPENKESFFKMVEDRASDGFFFLLFF
jgi:hypothetical protein